MSSIWTPGGEHRVPPGGDSGRGGGSGPGPEDGPPAGTGPGPEAEPELSADEQARLAEAAQEVAAIRAQLAAAPPEQVVANHLIGLYELAAIHLSQTPPGLDAARLAIDALAAVLDACQGRLGELEPTLVAARSQIQLAFVAARRSPEGTGDTG
jgi:hypothetical protein